MIIVILFEMLTEFFDLFPSWERRRLLILDDTLRFLYGETELWNERLYIFAFRKDHFKQSVKMDDFNFELYLTKLAYGEDYIQNELKGIQSKDTDKLRSLAQNEMLIIRDKNSLPYFYAIKISLMIYWLIGQDFVLNSLYQIAYNILWTALDTINNRMYLIRNTPLCARTGACPLDEEVVLAYEPLPRLSPMFVLLAWSLAIGIVRPVIGWLMAEP